MDSYERARKMEEKMRKLVITVVLVSSLVFSACRQQAEAPKQQTPTPAATNASRPFVGLVLKEVRVTQGSRIYDSKDINLLLKDFRAMLEKLGFAFDEKGHNPIISFGCELDTIVVLPSRAIFAVHEIRLESGVPNLYWKSSWDHLQFKVELGIGWEKIPCKPGADPVECAKAEARRIVEVDIEQYLVRSSEEFKKELKRR